MKDDTSGEMIATIYAYYRRQIMEVLALLTSATVAATQHTYHQMKLVINHLRGSDPCTAGCSNWHKVA